jgi:hypothetical protein
MKRARSGSSAKHGGDPHPAARCAPFEGIYSAAVLTPLPLAPASSRKRVRKASHSSNPMRRVQSADATDEARASLLAGWSVASHSALPSPASQLTWKVSASALFQAGLAMISMLSRCSVQLRRVLIGSSSQSRRPAPHR